MTWGWRKDSWDHNRDSWKGDSKGRGKSWHGGQVTNALKTLENHVEEHKKLACIAQHWTRVCGLQAYQNGAGVSVENPPKANEQHQSLWDQPRLQELFTLLDGEMMCFSQCQFGGLWQKDTQFFVVCPGVTQQQQIGRILRA